MPAKTSTKKSVKTTQAKKSPAKKAVAKKVTAPVSPTPLLDAAKANNPHKAEGKAGWDPEAAKALAVECGLYLAMTPEMPLVEAVRIINEYKTYAGWANCIQAASIGLGVSQPTRKLSLVPATANAE